MINPPCEDHLAPIQADWLDGVGRGVTIFEGQEIHREAATALHLFRDAAELEQATLGLVHNLATYLVRASRDPAFVYQAGS